MPKKRLKINLALQGGGAHGAFTWGVLDRLLAEPDIDFDWISGTSAGAVNAVALASGLAANSRAAAREKLKDVWEAVQAAGVSDLVRLNPLLAGLARAATMPNMAGVLSPYDFNPLGIDPLRKLIETHIPFADIRNGFKGELLIAATDVATGRARLFRKAEMTADVVLASACLPTLHHAVTIEGRAYWDGGFSANPDLVTLATESPVGDTLLVQLNPSFDMPIPRSASEIANRVNTITFNQPLLRDVAEIVAARASEMGMLAPKNGRIARLRAHRFHLIDAGRHISGLGVDSKAKPEKSMIAYLFKCGEGEAARWLGKSRSQVGKVSSVDLEKHFLRPLPVEDAAETAPKRSA
jgi:NTE family protein